MTTLDQSSTEVYVCDVLQLESELDRHQQHGTGVNKEIWAELADEQIIEPLHQQQGNA